MGAFTSRLIEPVEVTFPQMPTGLLSPSQSGVLQFRATQQVGRRWTETFGLIDAETATGRAVLTEINQLWRNGTIFNITHRRLLTVLGAGGGAPLVNGAGQTGSSIVTDGWPNNTVVLKAGDIVNFGAGPPPIHYDVTSDVSSNGSGQATIPINPPIFAGASPADNGVITFGALTWRVRIVAVEMPSGAAATLGRFSGLRVTMQESVV